MDLDRIMSKLNPMIVRLLESPVHGLLSRGLLVVHVEGRRTGKRYKIPVGYQRKGENLVILISKARRKNWWRNYIEPKAVNVTVRGVELPATASLLDKKSEDFERFVTATFQRIPALSKQFGISRPSGPTLSAEQLGIIRTEAEAVEVVLVTQ